MKKLIYTIGLNGYDRAFARCIESQKEYAAGIGAVYIVVRSRHKVADPALAAWLKVTLMKEGLDAGYDAIGYIDADCEVRSTAPDFKEVFQPSASVYMANGRSGRLNSGVIFTQNTAGSHLFFDRVIESLTEDIPESARANLKFENGNIIYCSQFSDSIRTLDARWNNTADPLLDDFIRHYTGPLRHEYKRSAVEQIRGALMKWIFPRASSQPIARTEEFVRELSSLTADAVNRYPQFATS